MLTRAALILALTHGSLGPPPAGPRPDLAQDQAGDAGSGAGTDDAGATGRPAEGAPDPADAGPDAETQPAPGPALAAPAADSGPRPLAVPDPQQPLPRCDTLPGDAAGMTGCTLDAAGTILTFAYSGTTADARLILTQSAPEGGERVISDPIRVTGVTLAPVLTDLDGDGTSELFLPVGRIGDETLFELWLPDETFFFARADEIAAPSTGAIAERDGLLVLTVPDPAMPGAVTETALVLDPAGLTELYSIAIDPGAQTCTLLGGGNGGDAILNAALIEAECADRLGFPAPGDPDADREVDPGADPGNDQGVLTETPAADPSPTSL